MLLKFSQSTCENKLEEALTETFTVKGKIIQRVKPYSTMYNVNDDCLRPTSAFAIEASISEAHGNLNA
jgi:hypothetical protein